MNAITCTSTTSDRRGIVTGDKGPNSSIIVWDTKPFLAFYDAAKVEAVKTALAWNMSKILPIKTVFDAHGGQGVVAADFSHDKKFLLTLGAGTNRTFVMESREVADLPLR